MMDAAPANPIAHAPRSEWWRVGGTLLVGLFVANLDRINISVTLPTIAQDLGFAGDTPAWTSSWVLTIFLIGYAAANVLGGFFTRHLDPKTVVIWTFAIWSAATVAIGLTSSTAILLACRLMLGLAEGVYWPQQSRFARAWFAPRERTRANSVIQYYGQFIALAVGFVLLTLLDQALGWRAVFLITGGAGLVFIVPLFAAMLRPEREAPYSPAQAGPAKARLTAASFGGLPFLLLVFSFITQAMLFWGISLWIPLAVRSLGFTGISQGLASAVPFAAACAVGVPMSILSDRTNKRVLIAASGFIIPGLVLLALPQVETGSAKLALITVALGYWGGTVTPNIWSILQGTVEPRAVGPASGIMNGVGAGGGGTIGGFLVAFLNSATGSYMAGFTALGGLVLLGGASLLVYGRLKADQLLGDNVRQHVART